MSLDHELQVFSTRLGDWLDHHAGKYALIRGDDIGGFYDTGEAAYAAGVERWGNEAFLVKRIAKHEAVERMPSLVYGLIDARF